MSEAVEPVDTQGIEELSRLESIVRRGKETFIEVGRALMSIQEGKLYRQAGFNTFEDYCWKRWSFARRTAYSYIEAAQVAENVQSIAQNDPPSYTQASALAPLDPDQQREVAADIDFKTATVAEVKAAVKHKQAIPKGLRTDLGPEGVEWPNPDGSVDENPELYKQQPVTVVTNEEDRWDKAFRVLEEVNSIIPRAGSKQESMRRWTPAQLAARLTMAEKVDASLKSWIKLMKGGR